jgi:hypothetical protein
VSIPCRTLCCKTLKLAVNRCGHSFDRKHVQRRHPGIRDESIDLIIQWRRRLGQLCVCVHLQFRQWGRERSPGPGCERNFCEELRPQLIGDCLTGGLRGRRISGLVYERKSLLGASRQRRRQKPQLLDATPRDHWLGASVSATEERANFPEVSESSVLIGAPSSELWCGPRPAFPATRG